MDITPINGCVLVRLTDVYEFVTTPDKKYDTKISGILLKVDEGVEGVPLTSSGKVTYKDLIGKKVFFESYKDDTSKEEDGNKYALIKAEELKGYEDA